MKTLALSGWAQYPESLANVVPEDTTFFSYGEYGSVDACFAAMKKLPQTSPHIAIGWSLGGQLLVRAIAEGVLKPKWLVLLAAPFQLVADSQFRGGVPKAVVNASRLALKANPGLMLSEFQAMLLARGDSRADHIKAVSPKFLAQDKQMHWNFWYDELVRFSCYEIDFSRFPPTDIIHGTEDAVIPYPNALAFAKRLPVSSLHRLNFCGHAPHWHDANFVRRVITGGRI